jgi:LCP family protein required for cell wall assembly
MPKRTVFWGLRIIAAGAALVVAALVLGATLFPQSAPVTKVVSAVERVFVPEPATLFGKDHLSVLLIGLDYDYDRLDQETSKSSRSDVIMALNVDFKNYRVNELSVPRDMIATMPNGQKAKINQAQSEGGIKESKAVIADWLEIPPFDRYILMRIDTSKDVINAIGGVDVIVKNSDALKGTGPNGPVDYDDSWGHLHIHLKPGFQHLDGEHAVGYARFRHDWCSDPCRIMRQQQVIRAIVDRVTRNHLNTLTHARALLGVIRKDIETDFTTQEEISSALALSHISARDVHTSQVPYIATTILPDYGDSLVPDEPAKQRLVAALLSQPAGTAGTASTIAASEIRIRVENGTTVVGLAARVAGDLRRKGFNVSEIRNAPTTDFAVTRIESDPAASSVSQLVQKALGPTATIVSVPSPRLGNQNAPDVTIVLGRDIIGSRR